MLKIEFEDEKDRVKISVDAQGSNHELANELAALISERNTIIMNIVIQRPSIRPILSKILEQEGHHEQND